MFSMLTLTMQMETWNNTGGPMSDALERLISFISAKKKWLGKMYNMRHLSWSVNEQ